MLTSPLVKRISIVGLAVASFGLGAATMREQRVTGSDTPVAIAPPPAASAPALPSAGAQPLSFVALAERVSPAVVHVKVVSVVNASNDLPPGFPFGPDGPFGFFGFPGPRGGAPHRQQGTGSGFVIQADGIIVTNNHVVENAREITVKLVDGRELPAHVLGRDPKTDLAVLKVDAEGDLPVVQLGDSDALQVGEWVVAVGNPFGLENTVTAGIVSAKGRAIGNGPYDQFIQTDAPINPGNSGGPLFDQSGRVVGINTAILSQGGGNVGIGFAIPINLAQQLLPQLEAEGHVTRGWLGVSIQDLTPALAESLGVGTAKGALVASVEPKSPAAKAGIERGDVITHFDGKPVTAHASLPSLVAMAPIGKEVPVEVLRAGKQKTLDVKIAKLEEGDVAQAAVPSQGKWGLALRELTPAEREQSGLAEGEGVLVVGVDADSPAAEAGLRAGDIVLEANRTPVGSVAQLREQIAGASEDKRLLLLVRSAEGGDRFAALSARG